MNETLRTLRWSAWLGWQIESNWTEPWLFAIYAVLKPVSSSLLLVGMYYAARVATGGAVPLEFLPYLYVSNAAFGLVGNITFGMSYTVIADRENYRVLKYIYISPARFQAFFVGRGVARAVQAVLGGLINLTAGVAFFPGVRDGLFGGPGEFGWLLFYVVCGTALMLSLGLILCAALMNMARHGMFLAEGISGMLFLLSGTVFPLSVLPAWAQAVSRALPTTYWLEGVRRSLIGGPSSESLLAKSPLAAWPQEELAAALAGSTLALLAVAQVAFRFGVRRAWRQGRFEETTGA